jgi:hypothetical protein
MTKTKIVFHIAITSFILGGVFVGYSLKSFGFDEWIFSQFVALLYAGYSIAHIFEEREKYGPLSWPRALAFLGKITLPMLFVISLLTIKTLQIS